MFTKYRNENLPDLKMQFDVFSTLFIDKSVRDFTLCMISDAAANLVL